MDIKFQNPPNILFFVFMVSCVKGTKSTMVPLATASEYQYFLPVLNCCDKKFLTVGSFYSDNQERNRTVEKFGNWGGLYRPSDKGYDCMR